MSFDQLTKNDLDRNLSTILHSAHHKAQGERARLTSEFAARGMASSTSLIGSTVGCLDKIHAEAIDQAMQVSHEFIARMNVAPLEIIGWARPHLFFFFNDTATTQIYTLSLHDARVGPHPVE